MLVLSRKADEIVRIGDDIEVHVVAIQGNKVRLGFRAPEGVKIRRQEIVDLVLRDKLVSPDSSSAPSLPASCVAPRGAA